MKSLTIQSISIVPLARVNRTTSPQSHGSRQTPSPLGYFDRDKIWSSADGFQESSHWGTLYAPDPLKVMN
jgi:hypothetical protein